MDKIDALILNPSALQSIYQSLGNELAAIEPPIWGALIANHLRVKRRSVALIDAEGESLTVAQTAKRAGDFDPKITVVVAYGQQPSASTQNMHGASALCIELKKLYPNRKIILVGGHVSALSERTSREEAADFVCQGEGPVTIGALLEADLTDTGSYEKIPGLWFKQNGKPRLGLQAPLISQERLPTELPGMAWDLLPMANYRAHNWHCFDHIGARQPYASLYTSLGCPFKCSFCCINAPFGGSSFRYWEPSAIIEEFETLANRYGVRNIKIADEMFVLNPKHFLSLCQLLSKRKYDLNIWAYARVDTIKPQYLEVLKAGGVNWLALGIESGSKHVRDGVLKGRFGYEDICKIVEQIRTAGIRVIGNYIFGLPDDNLQTMNETLDLAIELNCEMANFYSAMAYPGSQLYPMALEKGWRLPDSWIGYSQHAFECLPLPTESLTAGEVLAFRDYAFDKYFSSPRYLTMVQREFGNKTHDHIQKMTVHQLKRKHAIPRNELLTRLTGVAL